MVKTLSDRVKSVWKEHLKPMSVATIVVATILALYHPFCSKENETYQPTIQQKTIGYD